MAKPPLSDEDKALFRNHMSEVTPLKNHRKNTKGETQSPTRPPQKQIKPKEPLIKESYLSDFIRETVLTDTVLSYSNQSLSNKRFRELKTGQIAYEARLDLHGMIAEDARLSLNRFIQTQIHNRKRCLLIIHGKGGHQGAPPVLKNLVNRWLPQFDEVIAFHSALPKDGGTGAVYVFLKNNSAPT